MESKDLVLPCKQLSLYGISDIYIFYIQTIYQTLIYFDFYCIIYDLNNRWRFPLVFNDCSFKEKENIKGK